MWAVVLVTKQPRKVWEQFSRNWLRWWSGRIELLAPRVVLKEEEEFCCIWANKLRPNDTFHGAFFPSRNWRWVWKSECIKYMLTTVRGVNILFMAYSSGRKEEEQKRAVLWERLCSSDLGHLNDPLCSGEVYKWTFPGTTKIEICEKAFRCSTYQASTY